MDTHSPEPQNNRQTEFAESVDDDSKYYQDTYLFIRPSLPNTADEKLSVVILSTAALAMIIQPVLPAGTPPNSIKPWIGPLPFSFAWLFFWATVFQLGLITAYFRLIRAS